MIFHQIRILQHKLKHHFLQFLYNLKVLCVILRRIWQRRKNVTIFLLCKSPLCLCVQPFTPKQMQPYNEDQEGSRLECLPRSSNRFFNKRVMSSIHIQNKPKASLQLHRNTSNNSQFLKMTLGRNYHSTAALNNDKSWRVVLCVGRCKNEVFGLLRFMLR